MILDDLELLRSQPSLHALLSHYASLVGDNREVWQDRLMALDGLEAAEMSRLHGQLIAFDWIKQNTGRFGASKPGAVTGCYRITSAGLRALRLVGMAEPEEDEAAEVVEEGQAEPDRATTPTDSEPTDLTAVASDQAAAEAQAA